MVGVLFRNARETVRYTIHDYLPVPQVLPASPLVFPVQVRPLTGFYLHCRVVPCTAVIVCGTVFWYSVCVFCAVSGAVIMPWNVGKGREVRGTVRYGAVRLMFRAVVV